MAKPIAYLFINRVTGECDITTDLAEPSYTTDWYLAGEVNSLAGLSKLLGAHGYSAEFFYDFVDVIPYWTVRLLDEGYF